MGNLDRAQAGRSLRYDEAMKIAQGAGIKIIGIRWVINIKLIELEMGVRARIMVQDVVSAE